uniref:N-acetyltransferase domain-containing protein n=1 Tax=Anopheles triannulatus TaxID=58253 RepID=A0A2M4AUH3_9DIPT
MPSSEQITYAVATNADRDSVRDALISFYYPEEPLTTAHRSGAQVTPDDLDNSLAFIDRGTVTLARLSTATNGQPAPVVGIAIGGPSDAALNVPIRTRKFADIVAFLDWVAQSSVAMGTRPCYNMHCLAVHPAYRGRSIGQQLVEQQMLLAKRGWPQLSAFTADATARKSERLLKRLGLCEIGRLRFDEYRDERGDRVFDQLSDGVVVTLEKPL